MLQLLLKYFSDAPLSSKKGKWREFFFFGGWEGGGFDQVSVDEVNTDLVNLPDGPYKAIGPTRLS